MIPKLRATTSLGVACVLALVCGIASAPEPVTAQARVETGRFVWHDLMTKDVGAARRFYGELFGCPEGRSSAEWVDFDFFGHQVVAHLDPNQEKRVHHNEVDGQDVPVPHFGVVMEWDAWHRLAERL